MDGIKYTSVADSEAKLSESSDQEASDEFQHELIASRWGPLRGKHHLYAPSIYFYLSTCFLLVAIILFSLAAFKIRSSGPEVPEDYFPQCKSS